MEIRHGNTATPRGSYHGWAGIVHRFLLAGELVRCRRGPRARKTGRTEVPESKDTVALVPIPGFPSQDLQGQGTSLTIVAVSARIRGTGKRPRTGQEAWASQACHQTPRFPLRHRFSPGSSRRTLQRIRPARTDRPPPDHLQHRQETHLGDRPEHGRGGNLGSGQRRPRTIRSHRTDLRHCQDRSPEIPAVADMGDCRG